MKLVSPALLIEHLAQHFSSAEHDHVVAFILDYAADQGIDLPLKLVIGQMSEGADLFNPASDTPLTPEQYRRLYVEDVRDPVNYPAAADIIRHNPRSLSHGTVNQYQDGCPATKPYAGGSHVWYQALGGHKKCCNCGVGKV